MNSTYYKTAVWVLTLVSIAVAGWILFHRMTQDMFRLRASWTNAVLHIYSAKDGPWIVTHLVQMRPNSRFYDSVAQLPTPITIIDSRGEHFSLAAMQSLSWVDSSGAHVAAPKQGQPMSAFYFVPEQAVYEDVTK